MARMVDQPWRQTSWMILQWSVEMPVKTTEKKPAKTGKAATSEKAEGKSTKAPAKKPNALQQPLQPSPELAAVVGDGKLTRGEVVSKVWEYIKAGNRQNPDDRREILADDKLRAVFGKDKVSMFEMNKHLARHVK
ncbi:SWIB/MDM2 domain-containing protein [Roseomonas sp. KE0001]|uniref:SWIB/MDM2 domain-containing protein n=1 Tax=Roseomonas sp. KE0001 TaxID=2479201 RepID=UPI001E621158|nr:SWIB/MDM2 domain-containing protein [Roseomonas sp. KE0001]